MKRGKKLQRQVNMFVRNLNRNIEEDVLWRGRFCVRQTDRFMYDGQNWGGTFFFELYDRYTHLTEPVTDSFYRGSFLCNGFHLWEHMNNFIVDTCDAWDPSPYTVTADFTPNKDWEHHKYHVPKLYLQHFAEHNDVLPQWMQEEMAQNHEEKML